MKFTYWCLACGAYGKEPCDIIGHITKKVTSTGGAGKTGATIAADYLGKLRHLKVILPDE